MRRDDSVLCVCCGREFSVRLLELVRWEGPLWCQPCITYADAELAEAASALANPDTEGDSSAGKAPGCRRSPPDRCGTATRRNRPGTAWW